MTAIMNPSNNLSLSNDPTLPNYQDYDIPEIASATASNYEYAFNSPKLQDTLSGSASPTPSSRERESPAVEMPPPQTPYAQQQQRNTNPLVFPESDALLCPSMDGFLVASHQQDGSASWTPVSWPTFLSFVCNETNVGHLSPRHPMRLFAKIVRDNSLQSRLSPALHQPTLGLLPHQMPGTPMGRPMGQMGQANYSYCTPQPTLQRSTSAQHAIPRSPRYNPIAGRPQSARAVLHTGQLQSQQLSSPLTPYTPRFGQNQQAVAKRKPVELNQQDDAYIWNIHDKRLYIFGSKESENSMGKPENVMIVFPAGTTREAKEKDGSRALPAWTSSWPNSNTWLKEQVCGKGCSHANGFGQKRPVLIREHHRRCPHVPANHPLKTLCTLELEAHSKSQWAEKQLKRKRADLTVATTSSATQSPLLAPNTAMQWTPDINLSSLQQTPTSSYTAAPQSSYTPVQTPSYTYQQPAPSSQDIPLSFEAPTNAPTDLRIDTNVNQSPFSNPSTGGYDDLDSSSAFTLPSAASMGYDTPSTSSSPMMRDANISNSDTYSTLSNEEFNEILAMFGKDDGQGQRTN